MHVAVEQLYTSTACNRIPEICDWNSQGLICFGASNAVVVYDTNVKGSDPLKVLSHHRSRVNSVKWLRKPDGSCTEFLSCSADKTAALWTFGGGTWQVTSCMTGHSEGITCISGIYTRDDDVLVFTGSIDSYVRVWERNNGTLQFRQAINLNTGLCLTLHAHKLPSINKPLLFCALDDHKIHIYAGDDFCRLHTLVGHEDWVRGLDCFDVDESALLLASASQDTYIRIWRIQLHEDINLEPGIRVEERVFTAHERQWAVKLDSVLAGHEGWVYGVQWHPGVYDSETKKKMPVYRLLSSSLDKTLIIWEPDGLSCIEGKGDGGGAWVEKVRVGEVGGNGLGFYGSRFGPNGKSFLGHGYNGSFHIWKLNEVTKQWQPSVVCGGHFNAVEDVRWEPEGRYIMSVSADQTTRVHAPWRRQDGSEWHEISRPQVHGYDMASLAVVSPTIFASAAEEKVIRVFRAPHNFIQNFSNITGQSFVEDVNGGPEGASVPSLGLSNKAVFTGDENQSDFEEDTDGYFVPVNLTEPPTEETLMQNTLWPEVHKLYGHGYEVFALDASNDGALLASTCKANSLEHAAVILWDTTTWEEIQRLQSHSLTVTQLAFSPDSLRLLSVSRDRTWAMYLRRPNSNMFDRCAYTAKGNGVHSRIIWCCAWAHDGDMFGTGSRDGKVCLWSTTETSNADEIKPSSLGNYALYGKPLELTNTSVTAISFAPIRTKDCSKVIATGFESGCIRIYCFSVDGWSLLRELDNSAAHHLTVKRVTFKRRLEDGKDGVMLASCGADFLVRIYRISINC